MKNYNIIFHLKIWKNMEKFLELKENPNKNF